MYKRVWLILLLIPYSIVCTQQTRESQNGFSLYSSDQSVALDLPWTNLNGASCPITGSRAACATFAQTFSEFFEVRSFNFSIPENSNITSLSVSLQVQVDGEVNPRTREVEAALFRDGGNIKFSTLIISYTSTEGWNLTTGEISYPQLNEDPLWGTQWNPSEINSSDFGLSIRIENPSGADIDAYIHCIQISVDYFPLPNVSSSTTGGPGVTRPPVSNTTTTGMNTQISTTGISIPQTTSQTSEVLSSTTESSDTESAIPLDAIIYSALASAIFLLFCLAMSAIFYIIWIRKKKRDASESRDNEVTLNTIELNDISPSNKEESVLAQNGVYLDNIVIEEKLGGGEYGEVYRGLWNDTTNIACKSLKQEAQTKEFENEVSILKKLNHVNIVRFYGIFLDRKKQRLYMIMEYLCRGSLDQFLRDEKIKDTITINDMLFMLLDICAGMSFLEKNKMIHRDLAARNVLVTEIDKRYIVKIADLGMGREVDAGFYLAADKTAFPVKWSAPEVIEDRKFSIKSDVWSFGIVMWEIYSYGATPYPELSNSQTAKWVVGGHHMEKPQICPDELYEIILQCWDIKTDKRPSFFDLNLDLRKLRVNSCNRVPSALLKSLDKDDVIEVMPNGDSLYNTNECQLEELSEEEYNKLYQVELNDDNNNNNNK